MNDYRIGYKVRNEDQEYQFYADGKNEVEAVNELLAFINDRNDVVRSEKFELAKITTITKFIGE